MIWTIIEAGLAIVASSLATIRPLLRAMRVRGFEATDQNTGNSGSAGPSKRSFQHSPSSRRHPAASAGAYGLSDLPASNEHLTECMPSKMSSPAASSAGAGRRAVVVTEITDPDHIGPVRTVNVGDAARSEVYVVQGRRTGTGAGVGAGAGGRTRSMWSGRSTESMEQIHDLEAQSQEYPNFGIGSDSEK